MRLLVVLALVLGACASPGRSAPDTPGSGLSAAQAAELVALGVPVLIADDLDRFRLTEFSADRTVSPGFTAVSYRLGYRRDDGACFEVYGGNDGFGGPDLPLVSQAVRLAALPGRPTVELYRAADDPSATSAQDWGAGTVISDYIEVGDAEAGGTVSLFRSASGSGCRALSLAEAAPIFARLRLVDGGAAAGGRPGPPAPPRPPTPPATVDLTDLGPFADAPTVRDDPAVESGRTPEEAARGLSDRYEGRARSVQVQIIQSVGDEATVLVTATGLGDDSVDGERYRLTYREGEGGTWFIEDAGLQVRCHAGRGHTDWAATPCS